MLDMLVTVAFRAPEQFVRPTSRFQMVRFLEPVARETVKETDHSDEGEVKGTLEEKEPDQMLDKPESRTPKRPRLDEDHGDEELLDTLEAELGGRGNFVSPGKTAFGPGLVDVYYLVGPFLSLQGRFAKIEVLTTVKFGHALREFWQLPSRCPRASYQCPWARGIPAFVTNTYDVEPDRTCKVLVTRVLLLRPMHHTADCSASTSPSGQEKDQYILSAQRGEFRKEHSPGVYLSCARGHRRQIVGNVYGETVATLHSGGLLVSAETPLCSRECHKLHASVRCRPLALQRAVRLEDSEPARFTTDRQLWDMADNYSECGQRLFVADTTVGIAQSVATTHLSGGNVVTVAVRLQAGCKLEGGEEADDERRFIMQARQSVKTLMQAWVRDVSPPSRPMCLPHALDARTGTILDDDTHVSSLPIGSDGHHQLILKPSWPPSRGGGRF